MPDSSLYPATRGLPQITQDKMQDLFQLKERMGFGIGGSSRDGNASCGIPSPVTGGDALANPLNDAEPPSDLTERIRGIVQRVLQERGK
jgi:hypothetical protein